MEANIALWNIITGKSIGVDALDWEGVKANITRKDSISGFNFQFLIDAFSSPKAENISVDTTKSSVQLVLKNLTFKDFDVIYKDDVSGIDSHFVFERLKADMDTTNPETMQFYASKSRIRKCSN